jgi:hypothetical protein
LLMLPGGDRQCPHLFSGPRIPPRLERIQPGGLLRLRHTPGRIGAMRLVPLPKIVRRILSHLQRSHPSQTFQKPAMGRHEPKLDGMVFDRHTLR